MTDKEPTVTMERPELVRLLRMAHDEIITLRRQVADLEPRARAYDNIDRIIRMIPRAPQGHGEDVAWSLKQTVERITAERDAEKEGRNG